MEVVKFKDGTYGIRKKGWLGYEFYHARRCCWCYPLKNAPLGDWARYATQEHAEHDMHNVMDRGTPVKKPLEVG